MWLIPAGSLPQGFFMGTTDVLDNIVTGVEGCPVHCLAEALASTNQVPAVPSH